MNGFCKLLTIALNIFPKCVPTKVPTPSFKKIENLKSEIPTLKMTGNQKCLTAKLVLTFRCTNLFYSQICEQLLNQNVTRDHQEKFVFFKLWTP